jgi:hypothetical protein
MYSRIAFRAVTLVLLSSNAFYFLAFCRGKNCHGCDRRCTGPNWCTSRHRDRERVLYVHAFGLADLDGDVAATPDTPFYVYFKLYKSQIRGD